MRRRVGLIVAVGLLLSLVIAGWLSYYASNAPDGLNKVAADNGLDEGAVASAASGLPTAGYSIAGISSDRLAGGLAGILGVVVVGLVAFGMFRLLSRSSRGEAEAGRS